MLIGHRLTPKKKAPFLRALHAQMDAIFVYATTQKEYGEKALGIPGQKLHLIPFHADSRFYQPAPGRSPGGASAARDWNCATIPR